MNFSKKQIKVICLVIAIAMLVPIALSMVSVFVQ